MTTQRKGYLSGYGGSCSDRMCGDPCCTTCFSTAISSRWDSFHEFNESGEHEGDYPVGCTECERARVREEEGWEE